MNFKDEIRKKLGKVPQTVSMEQLQPPKPPEPMETEEPIPDNIFLEAAENYDFQRFIIWIVKKIDPLFKGVTTRNNRQMLTQIKQRAEVAKELYKLKRGTKEDFMEVVKELKVVLEKRKEVVEKNE
jgi:hypothetical protein